MFGSKKREQKEFARAYDRLLYVELPKAEKSGNKAEADRIRAKLREYDMYARENY